MGMGAQRFCPMVASEIKLHYPQITDLEKQTISFFDPAAFTRNAVTEETYLSAMRAIGFTQVRPGPMAWMKRVESVNKYLVGLVKGEGKIQIYEPDCPTLVAGFKGGFRYPDSVSDKEPDKLRPIKDAHSHPHDGLQYMCGGLDSYKKEGNYFDIPVPHYGFQKTENKIDITPTFRREAWRK